MNTSVRGSFLLAGALVAFLFSPVVNGLRAAVLADAEASPLFGSAVQRAFADMASRDQAQLAGKRLAAGSLSPERRLNASGDAGQQASPQAAPAAAPQSSGPLAATLAVTCASTCSGTTCASTCSSTCSGATCSTTCLSTCSGTTCASTCQTTCSGTTCAATCSSTCSGATCSTTCLSTCSGTTCATTCQSTCSGATCAATCSSTCSGATCATTCLSTCSGATCSLTCSSTCTGAATCSGSATCGSAATCAAAPTCGGTATCSGATCTGASTCIGSATCGGTVTCAPASTCAGASTCSGVTCGGTATCSGVVTCAGTTTCTPATCNGNYYGLFTVQTNPLHANAGFFKLSLTKGGTYSASLRMGSAVYRFSGAFDSASHASATVPRRGLTPVSVEMTNGAAGLSGLVRNTAWVADLFAGHCAFDSRTNPAPCAGHYTLLIPGAADDLSLPGGDGFGVVTVSKLGRVALSGTLADATSYSQGAGVSASGFWPLYVPLYKGQGSLYGWVFFDSTNRPPADVYGALNWFKPVQGRAKYYAAGFTNGVLAEGSKYARPSSGAGPVLNMSTGLVSFEAANATEAFTNLVRLTPQNKIVNASPNTLNLVLNLARGTFSGRVFPPGQTRAVRYSGALYQKANFGSGFWLETNRTGRVLLDPAP